ncbi:MAG: hypothetical protein M0030_26765 [Actinomycetota bacterium]|nr:hypothetical protein [Actinomycetota bacterium]
MPGIWQAQTLLDTWKAMTAHAPDDAEVVPPWLPFWAMDSIASSAPVCLRSVQSWLIWTLTARADARSMPMSVRR